MKIATLAMTLVLALGVAGSAAAADVAGAATRQASASVAVVQDAPVAQLAQAQEAAPSLDVNVDVDRGDRAWFASPIWIAIFVLGGVLLLVLIAMAVRGGGGQPQTIVK